MSKLYKLRYLHNGLRWGRPRHPQQLQLIRLVESLPGDRLHGAEVGVRRGRTSAVLMWRFPQLSMTVVDAWSEISEDHRYRKSFDAVAAEGQDVHDANYRDALRATEFARKRRRVIRAWSLEGAREVADASLDFCFIDAAHDYESVREDIEACRVKVKPGGLLSGHDYGYPEDRAEGWGVDRAVDEFAQRENLALHSGDGWTWWVHLSQDAGPRRGDRYPATRTPRRSIT